MRRKSKLGFFQKHRQCKDICCNQSQAPNIDVLRQCQPSKWAEYKQKSNSQAKIGHTYKGNGCNHRKGTLVVEPYSTVESFNRLANCQLSWLLCKERLQSNVPQSSPSLVPTWFSLNSKAHENASLYKIIKRFDPIEI